jgi:hypothetical protein
MTQGFKMLRKLSTPGKLAKYHLKHMYKEAPINGIYCTYAGFLSVSNGIGQVAFPRKQEEPDFSIIITNRIQPMLMAGNTINHFEIMADTPAAVYSVERKEDEGTNLFYWDIKKRENPDKNIIPGKSIVIMAKPKNFFIPEGISLTTNSPNLVLPTVYAKKGLNIATNALQALKNRQFFDAIKAETKQEGKTIMVQEAY